MGDKIRVTKHGNSHNYIIGAEYEVCSGSNSEGMVGARLASTGWTGNMLYPECMELVLTRAEQGEDFKKRGKELVIEGEKMYAQGVALLKYKDDNDELAHLIAETLKGDGTPASIYAVLQKFNLTKK